MAKKISGSVGKGGKNKPKDVLTVQKLLNGRANKAGYRKLGEDSQIGPKTTVAIGKFQKHIMGMNRPDSRVDPGGKTMLALSSGPSKPPEKEKPPKDDKQEQKGGAGCLVKARVVCATASRTKRPVQGADVKLANKKAKTKTNGDFTIKVKPGRHKIEVLKRGFKHRPCEIRAIDGGTVSGIVIELVPDE
jgi:hypothetical protein